MKKYKLHGLTAMYVLQVYGELKAEEGGEERFEFSHSYSEVHKPPPDIKPDGIFMSFQHYNVEIRKRVKCVSAKDGES